MEKHLVCSALILLNTINSTCLEGYCLLRCDVVLCGRRLQIFCQTSGNISSRLHGVTSQKVALFSHRVAEVSHSTGS
jgi:hypothetical protein